MARGKTTRSKAKAPRRDNSGLKALKDDLVAANRILFNEGVLDGFGHVSFRDPNDPTRFHMSRALAPGRVTVADILEYGLDGEAIDAPGVGVYSERFIHSEAYRARPDVMAVVHSHSPTVIPFSVTQVPLLPIRASFFYPEVPVFEIREKGGWTNLQVTNSMLGKALADKLGGNSVALMRGHGNIVVAPDLRVVVSRAINTEMNARFLLQARMLGGPITYLAPEEAAEIEKMTRLTKPGSEHGQDRTWEMWKESALGKSKRRRR
ncbi:MAG TPA: class II aldolase/adducin family protein [Stellaceae bacterium]|nr:class II aldolase/adducin family protein [Stellaceae bacterium]